jgi:transcriptional regulator with XRE-family HTH domain
MPSQPRDAEDHRALTLGALIRRARKDKKLSQKKLAAKLSMSQGHLSRIEAGEHAPPSDDMLIRMAEVLGLDPRVLLRAAGRHAAGTTFEQLVLDRLDALKEAVDGLSDRLAQQEQAIQRIERASKPKR